MVTELKARHFIDLLKGIETKGLLEVASCTRQHLCNIMRHAVQQGIIEHNPAANLEGIISPPVKRHYPALSHERLPELLSRIDGYHQGRELTRLAVSLTLHVFIRSSELRFARWKEISFRNKIWTIPATREPIPGVRYSDRWAKMRAQHIVPLSQQAIDILKKIREISGAQALVFPSIRNPSKPMSENTVNKALRLMEYNTKEDVCGHGFRAMACSALKESGICSKDVVERQMSHQERKAYGQHISTRRSIWKPARR